MHTQRHSIRDMSEISESCVHGQSYAARSHLYFLRFKRDLGMLGCLEMGGPWSNLHEVFCGEKKLYIGSKGSRDGKDSIFNDLFTYLRGTVKKREPETERASICLFTSQTAAMAKTG